MTDDLQGKVILVTGGAMGIGEAVVRRAAASGAKVAVIDVNLDAAAAVAAQLPGARAYIANIAIASDIERVCAAVVGDFGRLDGAVNNAGVGGELGPLTVCSTSNWERTIGINLTGTFNSLKAELPYLVQAGGAIVNMASLAGVLAEANLPAYIASKHGVIGLTKSVALDYGPMAVRCNAVCPSFVKTPMTLAGIPDPAIWESIAQRHPMRRLVTADEVAEITVFLLSDRAGGITGASHLVDCGIAVA
ncbi:SDR family NAD(P)-dependent oxidoreductase [Bradyrhizobium sp.]|uniref:SDR family NAD(P)-dependent oxidoreductase n=1 Tax=Bradyrhizobium sp. TaxID=376 RepID=UPI00039EBABB